MGAAAAATAPPHNGWPANVWRFATAQPMSYGGKEEGKEGRKEEGMEKKCEGKLVEGIEGEVIKMEQHIRDKEERRDSWDGKQQEEEWERKLVKGIEGEMTERKKYVFRKENYETQVVPRKKPIKAIYVIRALKAIGEWK